MKISKDEARILGSLLEEAKFELSYHRSDKLYLFQALHGLQTRLEIAGKDLRRTGRKSQDAFSDCLKRYAKTNK